LHLEAVIFDVDGVLTDSEPLHLAALNEVLSPQGVQLSEEENREYLGLDEVRFWELVIPRFNLKGEAAALITARMEKAVQMIRNGIVSLPGVPECITGLIMRGIPLACASSSPEVVVEAILDELGLRGSFQAVCCGDQVAHGKPDPTLFLEAAKALDMSPESCMAVEDSLNGITAARRAGMFTIAVRNQYNADHDLSEADRVFSGLDYFDWSLFDSR